MSETSSPAAPAPADPDDTRRRRLKIRSWRRGTREMDLLLGGYFDHFGAAMTANELDAFDALLAENDTELYAWISAASPTPAPHAPLIAAITAHQAAQARAGGA